MSQAPALGEWAGVIVSLSLGVTVAVVATALVAAMAPSGAWRRTVWQVGVTGVAILVVGELTGVARVVVDWCSMNVVALVRDRSNQAEVDSAVRDAESSDRDGLAARLDDPTSVAFSANRDELFEKSAQAGESRAVDVERGAPDSVSIGRSPVKSSASQWWRVNSLETSWWPGAVWSLGTIIVLARVLVGRALLGLFRRRHRPRAPVELTERVQALARRLGVFRRVRVVCADGIFGPIAFGTLRPTVGLPPRFAERHERATQDAMLAHEVAHLASHDPAWRFGVDLLTAALWWHPLVWWLRRGLCAASELAADEASLVVRDGPNILAACLVELGSGLTRPRPAWVGITGSGLRSNLARRVERLLSMSNDRWRPPSRVGASLAKILGPTALVVVSLLGTGWAASQTNSDLELSKGDPVMFSIQNSWRHSLAAVTVMGLFGASDANVQAAAPASEPNVTTASAQKEDDGEKKARQEKETDEQAKMDAGRAKMKEKLAAIEREIDELRAIGDVGQAEKLAAAGRELKAALEKSAGDKDGKAKFIDKGEKRDRPDKGDKKPESADKSDKKPDKGNSSAEITNELHARLKAPERGKDMEEAIQKVKQALDEALRANDLARLSASGKEGKEAGDKTDKTVKIWDTVPSPVKPKVIEYKSSHDRKKLYAVPQQAELGALLKDLREEVGRLRDEVSELRQIVKSRGSLDPQPIPPVKK